MDLNTRFYDLLERVFLVVEPYGVPIALVAWITVFAAAVCLGLALRRVALHAVWRPALLVGVASLGAHLADYLVTLQMSPDLAAEANPLWRIVIERWSLGTAKFYGLSGKILLSIMSFELFALYLLKRAALYPNRATGFTDFWREFGAQGERRLIHWANLGNFFAFSFALLGPFFFYIALLNRLVESPVYLRFPPLLWMLLAYLGLVAGLYFVTTYHGFRSSRSR